jgi:hypothetical protein
MGELPHGTRLVVRVPWSDRPDALPEVEVAGTREGLEWLAGQLLAVARSEFEGHTHLDRQASGALLQLPGSWGLRILRHKEHGPRPEVPTAGRTTTGENTPQPLHDHCAVCGSAIHWGDPVVKICRDNVLVTSSGDCQVIDGDELASVCVACGPQYPAKAIRVVFGEPQRRAEPAAAPDPAT